MKNDQTVERYEDLMSLLTTRSSDQVFKGDCQRKGTMMFKKVFCALTLSACIGALSSQPLIAGGSVEPVEADPMAAYRTEDGLLSITKAVPSITTTPDYTGDFWERSTGFGDVLGRQDLYEKGIIFDLELTQVYQGVASGGPQDNGNAQYSGLVDYGISFDTAKMGWWSGGIIFLRANTNYGNPLLGKSGTILPTNYTALWPEGGKNSTFLMDYYLIQALPLDSVLVIGRLNSIEYLDKNKFANNPRNQFMNVGLSNNPLNGTFVSFSTYGVLTHTKVSESWGFNLAVGDGSIQPGDYSGDDTGGLFSTFITAVDIQYHWTLDDNLNGDFDFTWLWNNRDMTDFSNPRIISDVLSGQKPPQKNNNNVLAVNIQQYLWKPDWSDGTYTKGTAQTSDYSYQEPGLGVFFRAGWTPEDINAYNIFVSGGIGGRGVFPSRPYDRFGIGGYWYKLSDDVEELAGDLVKDETGFEAYYNYAITPWMNLAADIQWINSGIRATENPVVLGTRLNIVF